LDLLHEHAALTAKYVSLQVELEHYLTLFEVQRKMPRAPAELTSEDVNGKRSIQFCLGIR
jgi:hypothetical protein